MAPLFAVWFSLGLTPCTAKVLRSALATLASDVAGERFAEINVRFFSKVDRESVITVLSDWSTWQLDWSTIQQQRKVKLIEQFSRTCDRQQTFDEVIGHAKAAFHLALAVNSIQCVSNKHPGRMPATAIEEVGAYYQHGVVSCLVETSVLANLPNPTLYRLGTTCTTRPTTSRPFRHTPPVTTQIARSPRLASPTSQLGCTSYATASAPLLQQ